MQCLQISRPHKFTTSHRPVSFPDNWTLGQTVGGTQSSEGASDIIALKK